ncbi:MAG: SDR family oxidoreductase [Acidimicrobiales bacterium]|nr:SDR family oxidoreductase [Acidimicrobiales bacterium]
MSADLSGQVAVVTGGNGGIGLGFAEGVAAAGADVAIWARNASKSADAVERLSGLGVRAEAIACDVADESSVAAAVADTVERLGRIDICVANAGTSGLGQLQDLTLDEWRRVMAVNVDGAFLTLRDCARQMIAQGDGGAMVAISSTSAVHGAPANPHYATSKTALLGLVRSSAVGLARHGIRVNAVLPGWTRTEMAEGGYQNEQFREVTTKRTPVRRWATGDDYRSLSAYLCDRSIDFHTGDTVTFDGGYTVF